MTKTAGAKTYCNARFGYEQCSLEVGHAGKHYDITTDKEWD